MYNFGHGISFKLDIFIVTQLNDDSNVWLGISTEVEINRKVIFMITGSIMSGVWNLSYRGFWRDGRGRT